MGDTGEGLSRELVERALGRDREALRTLVEGLTAIITARVERALARRVAFANGRSLRQEVEDLKQEVFAALFAGEGRALRAWEPERGLSLPAFIGLLAERRVATLFRTARSSPWTEEPALAEELDEPAGHASAEQRVDCQQVLRALLERLHEELSPLGLSLFELLYVQQHSVAEVCARTGMSRDAVYAWQSRLGRLSRRLGAELQEAVEPHPGSGAGARRASAQRRTF